MPWMKIDDSFESHPKVKSIPKGKRTKAIGLWTLAGSWCARHLTDGFVPAYMVGELGGTRAESSLLVAASLWREVDDGFTFHDWTDHQPTRAKVEEEREAAKERMRVARERKKGVRSGDVRANTSEQGGTVAENFANGRSVTPTRPDPTRPDPKEEHTRADALGVTAAFDEFWAVYPRKVAKPKALAAYKSASKKADAAEILDGLRRHLPSLLAAEARYRPHPATWLNGERWSDEPAAVELSNTQRHMALVQELAEQERLQIGDGR